ncbi:MAG: TrkA family potassium uptake protein [Magnetococcales bacterium]|nr:TrkA family potassium uptake protein [Magnetococcales bacterium]
MTRTLYDSGAYVLAVDWKTGPVNAIRDMASKAVCCDATNPDTMLAMGAFDMGTAIVAMRNHFDATVLITIALRKHGIPHITVQVDNERQAKVIQTVGATEVIFPFRDTALHLAHRLIHPEADGIALGRNMGIIDIRCPESFVDRTLGDLALYAQYGVTLVGLHIPPLDDHHPQELLVNLAPDTRLRAGHNLLLMGNHKQLTRFKTTVQQSQSDTLLHPPSHLERDWNLSSFVHYVF